MSGKFAAFTIRANETDRPVEVGFGSEADVRGISRWRAPKPISGGMRDALEFARLTSKRWWYYKRSIPTIFTLPQFETTIRSSPNTEVSFIAVARAAWFSDKVPLSLAQCRRTFCNNIIIEFLAVHPRAQQMGVAGIGSGIVCSIASIALQLRVQLVWGEATQHSAPFYKKLIELPTLSDHFLIDRARLELCEGKFRRLFDGKLEA